MNGSSGRQARRNAAVAGDPAPAFHRNPLAAQEAAA
jgi:hypothetical protein